METRGTRLKIHNDLCHEIHDLYQRKNNDYGDSFRKVRNELPWAILVRLSDKINRLKSLMQKSDDERYVLDETIDDTLMDIANYALLELTERRVDRNLMEEIQNEQYDAKTSQESRPL